MNVQDGRAPKLVVALPLEDDTPMRIRTSDLELEKIHRQRRPLTWQRLLADVILSVGLFAITACESGNEEESLPVVAPTSTPQPPPPPPPLPPGSTSGLDFPGSAGVATTMRFRFLNPLPIYPATYIWRAYPKQQAGYYTAFFWGNDDGQGDLSTFLWANGGADSYYGAHPYPNPPPDGTVHDWEISIEQTDIVNGAVGYNRWHIQALRVWSDASGKRHEFYWDLPNTDSNSRVTYTAEPNWGNVDPPVPTLTWGDAPWAPGNEVWFGVLRGIQVYSSRLSLADMLSEANAPLSTEAGAANIWYLNMNPIPNDISDKSGRGNDPEWVGNERPGLWTP
jgi:hypothetical protein